MIDLMATHNLRLLCKAEPTNLSTLSETYKHIESIAATQNKPPFPLIQELACKALIQVETALGEGNKLEEIHASALREISMIVLRELIPLFYENQIKLLIELSDDKDLLDALRSLDEQGDYENIIGIVRHDDVLIDKYGRDRFQFLDGLFAQ